jgi:hypothetical protein
MTRRAVGLTATIIFKLTPALKTALEVEAWESSLTLNEYIRGLLERRGKWARNVGRSGGYDIGPQSETAGVKSHE